MSVMTCDARFPKKFDAEWVTMDLIVGATFLRKNGAPYLGVVNLYSCTIARAPLPFDPALLEWGNVEEGEMNGLYVTDPAPLEAYGNAG